MDKIIENLFALYTESDSSVLESVSKEEMDKEWDLYFLILEGLAKKRRTAVFRVSCSAPSA